MVQTCIYTRGSASQNGRLQCTQLRSPSDPEPRAPRAGRLGAEVPCSYSSRIRTQTSGLCMVCTGVSDHCGSCNLCFCVCVHTHSTYFVLRTSDLPNSGTKSQQVSFSQTAIAASSVPCVISDDVPTSVCSVPMCSYHRHSGSSGTIGHAHARRSNPRSQMDQLPGHQVDAVGPCYGVIECARSCCCVP